MKIYTDDLVEMHANRRLLLKLSAQGVFFIQRHLRKNTQLHDADQQATLAN